MLNKPIFYMENEKSENTKNFIRMWENTIWDKIAT
jgi:hypothetical protein